MSETLTKQDVKEAVVEALEPLANAVREDFTRRDKRFDKIETHLESLETGQHED